MQRFNQSEAVQNVVRIVNDRQDVVGISLRMSRTFLTGLRAASCAMSLGAMCKRAMARASALRCWASQSLTILVGPPAPLAYASYAYASRGAG